ncbi:MAG TPA: hypothetical protein VFR81_23240, partial [Longimicrobium sp.]|nr:hypothetical protein [Longimicrobium sp.]
MHSPETALAYAGAVAAAWLLTYLVHSTLLIGAAWAVSRRVRRMAVHDLLWKVALVGGVATATLQLALRPGAADASARPAAALLAPVPLP